MRPIWKGSISFGLVNIPVELYTATKDDSVNFKLLHNKDHGAITYKRVCSVCHKEIDWQDIVKGLPLPDGTYFILTPEALEKLKPKKTDSISITEFVPTSAIEPIYYEHHYYISPTKASEHSFKLLLTALDKLNLSAIGQFVLRDKLYISAIKSYNNCLLLSTLNYDYQIKDTNLLSSLKNAKVDEKELKLAEQLINKLYVKKFDVSIFKDTFKEDLLKEIKNKNKPKTTKKTSTKNRSEESLLGILKKSLNTNISEGKSIGKR